ncbi:hypothetical protein [Pedobacter nototheniae]|uniref:hypothetical protein n=1 Tax=Pedobacter nototheniae TaxID=2488994 RepID=UPI001038F00C|nr:hypothetical protein [Pedobacter nototheniae]
MKTLRVAIWIERIPEIIFRTGLSVLTTLILKMIKKRLANVEVKLGSPALNEPNISHAKKRVVVYFPHVRKYALFPARP